MKRYGKERYFSEYPVNPIGKYNSIDYDNKGN